MMFIVPAAFRGVRVGDSEAESDRLAMIAKRHKRDARDDRRNGSRSRRNAG